MPNSLQSWLVFGLAHEGRQNLTFGLIFNRSLEKMALPRGLLRLSFGRAVASTRAW